MRKISAILIVLSLIASLTTMTFAETAPGIVINGTEVQFNDKSGYPYVDQSNRTMVPMRACMEAYGCYGGLGSRESNGNRQEG